MPEQQQQIFEFRGVDKFYYAELIEDSETAYRCGTPKHIPVQQVGKSVDSNSEAHYYDNKAMIVINSESADTITLVVAPPDLAALSEITGKSFDPTTGMMVDSPKQNKYFAIMYRTKGTDGNYRYVSRLKGQFGVPEETVVTEDDGTETNNTTLTFTGIYTEHEFTKGIYRNGSWEKAGVKGIVVDERYNAAADLAEFFDSVQTPDTVEAASDIPVTGVGLAPSAATLTVGGTLTLEATVTPADAADKAVTYASSDSAVAEVDANGVVTAKAVGSATITVTTHDGSFTDTSAITVQAAG